MKQILTLEDLEAAVKERRALCLKSGASIIANRSFYPAAFLFNMNASNILYMIRRGLFVYEPKKPRRLRPLKDKYDF